MKRLVLSIIAGVAFPFLYAIIVGPLSVYIENPWLRHLTNFPVRWQIYTLSYVLPLSSFPFRDEDAPFLFSFIIISDVLLYSSLTYLLLWRFWKRKSPQLELPPDPPRFDSVA
ncbi:MAG TPA: hypothetical protein VIR01_11845 [Pyrinomonadaceae bacterium]